MQNERTFFEQLAGATQPGWEIKLQPHMQPGQLNLASHSALVYVVDTSTGWTAAGAMQPSGFAAAARLPSQVGLSMTEATDLAGQRITQLGKLQPAADAPEVVQCIQLTATALTGTQTFSTVQASGDLGGHWVYIAYRLHDASTVARPVFFRTGLAGFLPTQQLFEVVRKVAAQDRSTADSTVGRMLKKGGGAIFSPAFTPS